MEGIERLRAARGHGTVTFSDVADHLTDFARRHPADKEVVERLAIFLATVERLPHDHRSADPGSTVTGAAPAPDVVAR